MRQENILAFMTSLSIGVLALAVSTNVVMAGRAGESVRGQRLGKLECEEGQIAAFNGARWACRENLGAPVVVDSDDRRVGIVLGTDKIDSQNIPLVELELVGPSGSSFKTVAPMHPDQFLTTAREIIPWPNPALRFLTGFCKNELPSDELDRDDFPDDPFECFEEFEIDICGESSVMVALHDTSLGGFRTPTAVGDPGKTLYRLIGDPVDVPKLDPDVSAFLFIPEDAYLIPNDEGCTTQRIPGGPFRGFTPEPVVNLNELFAPAFELQTRP